MCAALLFTVVHAVGMLGVRWFLWGMPPPSGWLTALQRTHLTNLDWLLMTYTTVVGFTYAVGYYREVQARVVRQAQLETRLMEARLKTLEAELQPALSVQHAARDLDPRSHEPRRGRPDDQPPQRPPPAHL